MVFTPRTAAMYGWPRSTGTITHVRFRYCGQTTHPHRKVNGSSSYQSSNILMYGITPLNQFRDIGGGHL